MFLLIDIFSLLILSSICHIQFTSPSVHYFLSLFLFIPDRYTFLSISLGLLYFAIKRFNAPYFDFKIHYMKKLLHHHIHHSYVFYWSTVKSQQLLHCANDSASGWRFQAIRALTFARRNCIIVNLFHNFSALFVSTHKFTLRWLADAVYKIYRD
jgi:hypothetical protein